VKKAFNNLIAKARANKYVAIILALLILAFGAGLWREIDDYINQSQTETVSEEKPSFQIGWSNLILFGVCVAALGVVKYKKSLKTDDDIKESKKDED
jgi:uncharacterized membrane protein YidH (DUF202 family)